MPGIHVGAIASSARPSDGGPWKEYTTVQLVAMATSANGIGTTLPAYTFDTGRLNHGVVELGGGYQNNQWLSNQPSKQRLYVKLPEPITIRVIRLINHHNVDVSIGGAEPYRSAKNVRMYLCPTDPKPGNERSFVPRPPIPSPTR